MKKNIISAAAWILLSMGSLAAQNAVQPSAAIAKKFESSFQGAQAVRWTALPKNITMANFNHMARSWVVYYDPTGNVIARGRRIKSTDELPFLVQEGFAKIKAKEERKAGTFLQTNIYELEKAGEMSYFCMLDNAQATVILTVLSNGSSHIEKRTVKTTAPKAPKNVLARRPQ